MMSRVSSSSPAAAGARRHRHLRRDRTARQVCSRGAFFLPAATQHVERVRVAREVVRALTALGGVVAWGVLLALVAG